jgi:glutamate formiminotransferase/glutamate formiminotransferase/formiminotetrahydrofolate cyclodeaminase
MRSRILLSVPNVSEGRDAALIGALGDLISVPANALPVSEDMAGSGPQSQISAVRLLDVHSDADHNRSVFSFAGPPGALGDALLRLASKVVEAIDVISPASEPGQHPHVGALDVAPIVYLCPEDRGAACAEALVVAERIGDELDVPVFLYGELTEDETFGARTRAELRRGGVTALASRMDDAETTQQPLHADFGPNHLHPSAGATLIAARPPLVAFNIQLAPPATLSDARRIAALIREGGDHGLPGLRAIGIELAGGVAQVSMNVERPFELSLVEVVRAIALHAPPRDAEIVALVPEAALEGFPEDLPIRGFDPARQVIEKALII